VQRVARAAAAAARFSRRRAHLLGPRGCGRLGRAHRALARVQVRRACRQLACQVGPQRLQLARLFRERRLLPPQRLLLARCLGVGGRVPRAALALQVGAGLGEAGEGCTQRIRVMAR
jgi:hypothetical protein